MERAKNIKSYNSPARTIDLSYKTGPLQFILNILMHYGF